MKNLVFAPILIVALCLAACSSSRLTTDSPEVSADLRHISSLLEKGDGASALARADELISSGVKSSELMYARGLALIRLGRYDEAEKALLDLVGTDESFYRAWSDLGVTYDETGRYTEAVAAYTQALKIEPKYFPALKNRGNSQRKLGHYADAAADYRAALEQEQDSCTKGFLAGVNELLGAPEETPTAWPSNGAKREFLGCRGIAEAQSKNCGAAIASFSAAIVLGEADSEVFNNRGYCFARGGDLTAALSDFEKAVALNPNNFQAVHNRDQAKSMLAR